MFQRHVYSYTVSGYWRETGLWCLHDGTCPFKSGAFVLHMHGHLLRFRKWLPAGEEEVLRHIVPVEEMLSDYPEFKTTDAFSDKMLGQRQLAAKEQVAILRR